MEKTVEGKRISLLTELSSASINLICYLPTDAHILDVRKFFPIKFIFFNLCILISLKDLAFLTTCYAFGLN